MKELTSTHASLQAIIEEQEALNEEAQAAIEEAQSANEELQPPPHDADRLSLVL